MFFWDGTFRIVKKKGRTYSTQQHIMGRNKTENKLSDPPISPFFHSSGGGGRRAACNPYNFSRRTPHSASRSRRPKVTHKRGLIYIFREEEEKNSRADYFHQYWSGKKGRQRKKKKRGLARVNRNTIKGKRQTASSSSSSLTWQM